MPPASNTVPNANHSKLISLGTSPDTDFAVTEPELQPRLNKKARKKEQQRAAKLQYEHEQANHSTNSELNNPSAAPAPSVLSQIPQSFAQIGKSSLPSTEYATDLLSQRVTGDSPPEEPAYLREEGPSRSPPADVTAPSSHAGLPPAQPGFSTRVSYTARSPPISPPQRNARPVSYGGGMPALPPHGRMANPPYAYAAGQYGSPPAPHLPQQHFYNARDVDVGAPNAFNTHGVQEPSLVKHTTLPSLNAESKQGILLGFDGRISLLAIENKRLDEIGALWELPGTVIDAVLLSWSSVATLSDPLEPLIALTLHCPTNADGGQDELEPNSAGIGYVTRVDVYSLSHQRYMCTLLETPAAYAAPSVRGRVVEKPQALGKLKLFASGAWLVVASGSSGEVFIFCLCKDEVFAVECLGKLWTNIQPQIERRDSSHSRASDTDLSPADLSRGAGATESAIIDVKGRWLIISPAKSPARPSLGARLGSDVFCRRNTGVASIAAPAQPSISCEVDSPDADTLFGKVARGVAQELVKGARWLGDQGYQTWQNYWKKEASPPSNSHPQAYSPPTYLNQPSSHAFPPTHGEMAPMSKVPELVSIFDLEASLEILAKRPAEELRPFATFQPPRGCSFVSMSPQGLNLLTAGRKGDVQYVWDLMQIRHCRAYITSLDEDQIRSQARVRQVAKYERLSGATIIDVAWDHPNGARFAILTKNRTVHMFDLPQSAFRWPPPRPARKAGQANKSVDNSFGPPNANLGSFFASAMNIASKAPPMVAGWRGRAPSMSGGLAGIGQTGIGIASATGARGGKAVAAGLSKSLGAASETVHHIRHAGESRLHLRSSREPTVGRICWTRRGRESSLIVLDPETIKVYRVRKTRSKDKNRQESVSVFDARKAATTGIMKLYELRTDLAATEQSMRELSGDGASLPGFYRSSTTSAPAAAATQSSHPLSFAEIETNAPYQPFHSDRRVILSIFDAMGTTTAGTTTTAVPTDAWVFGNSIASVKINLQRVQVGDDTDRDLQESVIYRETTVATSKGNGDMEAIVSTTRRSKKKRRVGAVADHEMDDGKDDFFEDDCEVLDFATDRV